MPLVGFEPTPPAGEGPHTYALYRAATGTGYLLANEDISENIIFFLNTAINAIITNTHEPASDTLIIMKDAVYNHHIRSVLG